MAMVIFAAVVIVGSILFQRGRIIQEARQKGKSIEQLVNRAKDLEDKNNFLDAKAVYVKLMNEYPASKQIVDWQKKVEDLNCRLLFSPGPSPYSIVYTVKQGDSLIKIANRFHTTVSLIKKINNIKGDIIIPGQKLKVVNVPFNLLIDKSQNTLMLKVKDEIIKTYVVATGKDNCTPTGTFRIINKLINPTWFKTGAVIPPDSPENILGSRWMGFDISGYGIHGTTDPRSLGKQVTQGCVRMSNKDVEELFIIVPEGTEVTIID